MGINKKSIVLFSLAPTFMFGAWITLSEMQSEAKLAPNPEVRVQTVDITKEKPSDHDMTLFDQMTGGERSSSELDQEWKGWVGDSEGLKLSGLEIPEHRLTMMLTEVRNLSSNPFRVLSVHAFAKLSEEDAVTLYNRELDGLEEDNVRSSLVAAMSIQKSKAESLKLNSPYRYRFELSSNKLKRAFDLRPPHGQSQFSPANKADFDLIQSLVTDLGQNEDQHFQDGTYRKEMKIADVNYDVQMTLRKTDIETFTIDLRVQEIGSLVINKHALIYE